MMVKHCLSRQCWKCPNVIFPVFKSVYTVAQWLSFSEIFFFSSILSLSSPGFTLAYQNIKISFHLFFVFNFVLFFIAIFLFLSFLLIFSSILSIIICFYLIFISNLDIILLIFVCFLILFLIEFCFQFYPSIFDFNLFFVSNLVSIFFIGIYFFGSLFLFVFFNFIPQYFIDWEFCFAIGFAFYEVSPGLMTMVMSFEG